VRSSSPRERCAEADKIWNQQDGAVSIEHECTIDPSQSRLWPCQLFNERRRGRRRVGRTRNAGENSVRLPFKQSHWSRPSITTFCMLCFGWCRSAGARDELERSSKTGVVLTSYIMVGVGAIPFPCHRRSASHNRRSGYRCPHRSTQNSHMRKQRRYTWHHVRHMDMRCSKRTGDAEMCSSTNHHWQSSYRNTTRGQEWHELTPASGPCLESIES
jgi:hypothetical protein